MRFYVKTFHQPCPVEEPGGQFMQSYRKVRGGGGLCDLRDGVEKVGSLE
jgi:hypothetical protein